MNKLNIYATKGNKLQRCLKCSHLNKACDELDGDWNGQCVAFKANLITRFLSFIK